MNLNTLLETLDTASDQASLIFSTNEGEIGSGYHVTELKHAHITGIDCGGRLSTWQEATLQLLDGSGGNHMAADKFARILQHSITQVDGLGSAELTVEFSPNNAGLRRYQFNAIDIKDDRVNIKLESLSATCKPAQAWAISCDEQIKNARLEPNNGGRCCAAERGKATRPAANGCCS